jgi:hypothetical protein
VLAVKDGVCQHCDWERLIYPLLCTRANQRTRYDLLAHRSTIVSLLPPKNTRPEWMDGSYAKTLSNPDYRAESLIRTCVSFTDCCVRSCPPRMKRRICASTRPADTDLLICNNCYKT